jgi:hypothetical protein
MPIAYRRLYLRSFALILRQMLANTTTAPALINQLELTSKEHAALHKIMRTCYKQNWFIIAGIRNCPEFKHDQILTRRQVTELIDSGITVHIDLPIPRKYQQYRY